MPDANTYFRGRISIGFILLVPQHTNDENEEKPQNPLSIDCLIWPLITYLRSQDS